MNYTKNLCFLLISADSHTIPFMLVNTQCHPTIMVFLAGDAFIRTNRRAIAVMFVRLSVCQSV